MGSHSAMQHQNQHPDVSVFIKNLSEITDSKTLSSVFAKFGNIVSCKLAYDEKGKSKGYAFVQFDTEESARLAIEKVNGTLLDEKNIYVGKFIPRKGRNKERDERYIYTNLYVKNFGNDFSEDELLHMFEPFGKIKSHKIMTNLDGHSKGFGFVAYEKSEYAEEALEKLNGKVLSNGNKLYVARAQKKAERQQELERQFEEQEERKRRENTNGLNLYVKNLDDNITDEQLRKEFSLYGPIASARIMTDNYGRSKGFGFVRFISPVDACFAAAGLNGRMFGTKPLFVSLAQRKNERRALLVAQHMRQRLQATESLYATSKRFYRRPLGATTVSIQHQQQQQQQQQQHTLRIAAATAASSPTASSCSRMGVTSLSPVRWTSSNEIAKQTPPSVWRSTSLAHKISLQRIGGLEGINRMNTLKSQSQANLRYLPPMPVPVLIPSPTLSKSTILSSPPSPPQSQSQPTPIQKLSKTRLTTTITPSILPLQQHQQQHQIELNSTLMKPKEITVQLNPKAPNAPAPATASVPSITSLTKFTKFSCFQQPSKLQQIPSTDMLSLHNYSSILSYTTSPPSESIGSRSPPSSESSSSCASGLSLHNEKQRIGERLFHRVEKFYPKLAGKITGMLLEMDNDDLYYLFENPAALHEKIDEAYQVYMAYLVDLREGNSSGNISANSCSIGGSPSNSSSGSASGSGSSIDTD